MTSRADLKTSEPHIEGVKLNMKSEHDVILLLVSHGHQVGLERTLQSQSQTDQSYRVFIAESLRILPAHPVPDVVVASLPAFRPTGGTTIFK